MNVYSKIKRKALKNLAKIDQEQKRHVKEVVLFLKNDPLPFKKTDFCKLKAMITLTELG
jgi:hypothetical protein